MLDYLLVLVLAGSIYALYRYGLKRLEHTRARQDHLLNVSSDMLDALTLSTKLATTQHEALLKRIDESNEYVRLVLSGFINSATDILTISEEEKKHLRNRLSASKLNK